MKMRILLLGAALAAAPAFAADDDRLPRDARPLSQIVSGVERAGYGRITDVEFDDGRWELKAWHEGRRVEIRVDPVSGRILETRGDRRHDGRRDNDWRDDRRDGNDRDDRRQ